MNDTLELIKNLTNRLWAMYGNPLANYKKTQHDMNNTYYVGKLMSELGHKWVAPDQIKGEHEDCAYYSEKALHDAFLAGQLLTKADNLEMRQSLLSALRVELRDALDKMEL